MPSSDQDNQKAHDGSMHNNSIISNNQMNQHLSSSSGMYMGNMSSLHSNVQNADSYELPEPPIPISDIGPIPPPPMFSSPSPTLIAGRPHGPAVLNLGHHNYDYDGKLLKIFLKSPFNWLPRDVDDQDELDSDEEFGMYPPPNPNYDTSRVDEIPAREPKFNAVPLKSALKKKTSNPNTPTQDNSHNKTLAERQGNSAFKWVTFFLKKSSSSWDGKVRHSFD